MRDFLPRRHLLSYLDAILRVYNRYGRRDNMYKARIKILVQALGIEEFARQVEAEWAHLKRRPDDGTRCRVRSPRGAFRAARLGDPARGRPGACGTALSTDKAFANWVKRCVHRPQDPGYAAVTLSLKAPGVAPGDITDAQMIAVADLADRFSFGELRVSHEQNVVLADVRQSDLYEVWQIARSHRLATANIGLLTDMICCPGGDLCALANARSMPIADAVQREIRRPRLPVRHRRHLAQHLGLHELLRPPSRRQHRHSRRRQEQRGVVPDHRRRPAGQRSDDRQGDRPVVLRAGSAGSSRR
jgi:sulfite reductase (NADPH) hemoprotein beta-component